MEKLEGRPVPAVVAAESGVRLLPVFTVGGNFRIYDFGVGCFIFHGSAIEIHIGCLCSFKCVDTGFVIGAAFMFQ